MYGFCKKCIDTLGSFLGVLVLSPLFLTLILLIDIEGAHTARKKKRLMAKGQYREQQKEDSAPAYKTKTYFGGAILGQERLGKKEKPFMLYKFRSMKDACVAFDTQNQTIAGNDKKVTLIGRFIRRFKIDELLQLVNVLKGDMCLVGPRPLLPSYESEYEPWMREKFNCKPGMSGLAQVKGGTLLTLPSRSYYDVYYARHAGFCMDVCILFKTIAVILLGEKRFAKELKEEQIQALLEGKEEKVKV